MRAIKREIAWKRERGKAIKSERVCTYEREIERSVEEWECVCVWERKMEREARIVSPNLFLFSCLLTWQASGTFWGESLFNSFASFVSTTTTTVVAATTTTPITTLTTTVKGTPRILLRESIRGCSNRLQTSLASSNKHFKEEEENEAPFLQWKRVTVNRLHYSFVHSSSNECFYLIIGHRRAFII